MKLRKLLQTICLLLALLPAIFPARAQEQAPDSVAPVAESAPATEPTASPPADPEETNLRLAREQLQGIQQSLVEKRRQLEQMRTELETVTDPVERSELQSRISREELDMSTLRRSFENIALGGVDSSVFEPARQNLQFNWQQELILIMEPLFQKLRELTDKPRQIEQLKSRIAVLEGKLRVVNRALDNLDSLRADGLDTNTRQLLDIIHQAWTRQRSDIQREQDITQLRMNVLQAEDDTFLQRVRRSLNEFVTGTGRNLALATSAFILTLLVMKGLFLFYNRLNRRQIRLSPVRRLLTYAYHTLTLFASTAAALIVLYLLGDMMLIVIVLIILALILLGLRNKVPMLIEETRLLLDLGSIREQERVVYRDLPWQVRSIGVYSYLSNPALNGLLRLPMTEMMGLISRPCGDDEPWFPSRTGDWVMFADGTVGQVLKQTPDTVQLRVRGSTVNHDTASFMRENLRNLSKGFSVSISFGIDYRHQPISTTDVPAILEKHIKEDLLQSVHGKHVENLSVEFQEAAASSLNYIIIVSLAGEAAESYFVIGRLLQRACVDACNANGWGIPFNQITVNAGTGFGQAGPVADTVSPQKNPAPG